MNKDIAAPRWLVVLGVTDALNRLVQISGKDDSWLDFNGYDFVIAADSGQKIARKLGLKIDIYVGDFDSSIRPEGILRVQIPDKKRNESLLAIINLVNRLVVVSE